MDSASNLDSDFGSTQEGQSLSSAANVATVHLLYSAAAVVERAQARVELPEFVALEVHTAPAPVLEPEDARDPRV